MLLLFRGFICILIILIKSFFFQLKDFQKAYPDLGTGNRAFRQAIENTETNIEWMKRNKNTLSEWLENVTREESSESVKDVRLPLHLVPETYDIVLKPNMYGGDPETFNFEGYVKIYMNAKSAGTNVTLHTNKLEISDETIKFGTLDGSAGPQYIGNFTRSNKQHAS